MFPNNYWCGVVRRRLTTTSSVDTPRAQHISAKHDFIVIRPGPRHRGLDRRFYAAKMRALTKNAGSTDAPNSTAASTHSCTCPAGHVENAESAHHRSLAPVLQRKRSLLHAKQARTYILIDCRTAKTQLSPYRRMWSCRTGRIAFTAMPVPRGALPLFFGTILLLPLFATCRLLYKRLLTYTARVPESAPQRPVEPMHRTHLTVQHHARRTPFTLQRVFARRRTP